MGDSDAELVRACLKGNSQSQSTLYHRYESRMYGICLRYARDNNDALDILQEGFIRIFRGLHSFKGNSPLANWMDRVMSNAAIRYISKNKRISFEEEAKLDRLMKTYDEQDSQLHAKDIVNLIMQLPIGYRTVFNMFAIEGYSHKEIAEKLGITEGGSRSQYFRAKKAIQNLLRENEMI
jgi:RNA polymerase sigma factor (sigma-70 family)